MSGEGYRLWSKLAVRKNGCHEFTGALAGGYGRIFWRGRVWQAHRLAYELSVGPIPARLQLDHLCRNRACCNPAHLEPVTQKENLNRGITKEVNRRRHAKVTRCPLGHQKIEVPMPPNKEGRTVRRICIECRRAQCRKHYAKNSKAIIAHKIAKRKAALSA